MARRDVRGRRNGKRKPDKRLSLVDWLPIIRLIIEWLLRQG
ncbi:hypothetical protein RB628_06920 [Streptomyces sp. ADMS]|nr:hypothetical protein [Streptomyces sp. ADMS]MDW4905085.1 hypothetical protein [Streptomyces sp. ADMS]